MERLYWEIEVRDKDGKLLTKRRIRSKSYLRQYIAMLKGLYNLRDGATGFAGNSPVLDEGGVSRTYPNEIKAVYHVGLQTNAPSGDSTYGLSVGTSDAVNTKDTVAMGSKIAHGVGAGQLQYGTPTYEDSYNPPATNNWIIRIIRTFTNGSGASITVREIGLVVKTEDGGGVDRFFLIARDVISPTVIPNGATLTVRYIPTITVA